MDLIFQILIIIYLFFGVPFHLGIIGARIFHKSHKSMSELMTNGYLIMLAAFCVVAVSGIHLEWSLTRLTEVWVTLLLAGSVVANILCLKQTQAFIMDMLEFWECKRKKKNDRTKVRYRFMALLAVVTLIAITFTRPSVEDATLEIVNTSIATDSMYVYDEYTGYISEYAGEGHVFSPIEMLYASAACLTGIPSAFMLYYLIPICFLFFFYMVLWRVGMQLFKTDKQIMGFEIIAIIIYWMTTYLEGQSVVTGIFLNSWNGLTLLSCCIMPVTFSVCMAWIREATEGTGKLEHKVQKICMAVTLLLAGQVTNDKGGFYIALMLFLMAAVIIARKGYDYVITSGRFKKRV